MRSVTRAPLAVSTPLMRTIGKGFNLGSSALPGRGEPPVWEVGPEGAVEASSKVGEGAGVGVGDGLPSGVGVGVGGSVSAGTSAVGSERFESDPRRLVTVSRTRITEPISDADTA